MNKENIAKCQAASPPITHTASLFCKYPVYTFSPLQSAQWTGTVSTSRTQKLKNISNNRLKCYMGKSWCDQNELTMATTEACQKVRPRQKLRILPSGCQHRKNHKAGLLLSTSIYNHEQKFLSCVFMWTCHFRNQAGYWGPEMLPTTYS